MLCNKININNVNIIIVIVKCYYYCYNAGLCTIVHICIHLLLQQSVRINENKIDGKSRVDWYN